MRSDPHSYADLDQARTEHLLLDLTVDFARRVLHGSATLRFAEPTAGPVDLDGRGLTVVTAMDAEGRLVQVEVGPTDAVLGERLRLHFEGPTREVTLAYSTGPEATGLMWLDPAQTDGGEHPFVLSQCQAIHARSLVPLQDTPRARITYEARLTVPSFANAVMSAAPGEVEDGPEDTRVLRFEMPQPIPPYLLALAVGQLDSRDLGPRCRVFAEPGVIERAAWEFEDVERMLAAAEELFGPYPWDRYDFIVLPPSFPLGGMENPRMTFLTPTLLAGDRSLVGVLAHELAHSWTGNLISNATNEHFWLNEGWTVYAERRILEHLYGTEEAVQQSILGRHELDVVLAERHAEGARTALTYAQAGLDPDAEFSQVPYEKGFLLITALERAVGRERFDRFVHAYMERFRFCSIDTATFVAFVGEALPDAPIDWDAWLHRDGVPADAPSFSSERLEALERAARAGEVPELADGSFTEKKVVLDHLPTACDPAEVAQRLGLAGTQNAELQSAWLTLAAKAGATGLEAELAAFVDRVGRTKLLRPVYRAMVGRDDLRPLAEERFDANRSRLHGSTRLALRKVLGRPLQTPAPAEPRAEAP